VERVGKHLGKLRRDDLVSLAERLEAGTLDLTTLTLSGDGGFGFQEEAREASPGDRGESQRQEGDGDEGEGLLERGAEQGRALLDKAKSAVTG
jgi:hypothetical protein